MHKIIALWAVPRSTSTAFEWMVRQRGDLDCLHEPYGEAWYQGEEPLWPRVTQDSLRTPGLTLESVHADLQHRAGRGPVFIKDFPHYVDHMWDAEMTGMFVHSFLIRDPAKTITSIYDKWPDFHEDEVGFPEQRALFDRIADITGAPPPVIDSDDLLEDPHRMVEMWCAAVGLDFMEAALSWEPGALNVVFGVPDEVSRQVLGSPIPKKMSFTGSIPVGKHLQKLAADTLKRCTMELGGHSPVIVFDDADIDKALDVTFGFKFRNAGQVCISPTRFFVQDKVYKSFVEGFTERTKGITVGNGLDDGVTMGPLIDARRLPVMEDFVSDARDHGATVTTGGERVGNQGFFYAPTVLADVPDAARIMSEEPFGPVAPMTPFNTFDEVVERANSLPFGLASYVFTSNGGQAAKIERALETGLVGVNHPMVATPETPFGGVNESGYGSEGGIEGLDAFLRTKFVTEVNV